MRTFLLSFTDPMVKIGGMAMGVMYLPQTLNIIQDHTVAAGVSLVTFGFLNTMQLSAAINCHLKGNKPMAQGFFAALLGSISVTITTVLIRLSFL